MLGAAAGGTPDPIVADVALIIGAVFGGVGVVVTAYATLRNGRPVRRRGRVQWPKEARDTVARLTKERDAAQADATEWKERYDAREEEWLRIIRYIAGNDT